ncbi:MAG: hypothetical protein WCT01_05335 [Candidatus Shapirobacteria bacterium]
MADPRGNLWNINTQAQMADYLGSSKNFDFPDETMKESIRLIGFIAFNPRMNPQKRNPYDPQAPYLRSFFEKYYGEEVRALAKEMWDIEGENDMRKQLELAARERLAVTIVGQVAAGKTTFLKTCEERWGFGGTRARMMADEPELGELYYPELASENDYRYQRVTTRGREATLGAERLKLFAWEPEVRQVVDVDLVGQGGHVRADRNNLNRAEVVGLFMDYRLMAETVALPLKVAPQTLLSSGETVGQYVLGLLATLNQMEGVDKPIVGAVTKLPFGRTVEDIPSKVEAYYEWCARYYFGHREYFEKEIEMLNMVEVEFDAPKFLIEKPEEEARPIETDKEMVARMRWLPGTYAWVTDLVEDGREGVELREVSDMEIDEAGMPGVRVKSWMSIYDDEPVFSGCDELLLELLRAAGKGEVLPIKLREGKAEGGIKFEQIADTLPSWNDRS